VETLGPIVWNRRCHQFRDTVSKIETPPKLGHVALTQVKLTAPPFWGFSPEHQFGVTDVRFSDIA